MLHRSLTGRLHRRDPYLRSSPEEALKRQGLLDRTLRYRVHKVHTLSFGSWLEPRYIFAARQLI
jgi:hypothetical protein